MQSEAPSREPTGWFTSKHLIAASCVIVAWQALMLATLGNRTLGPLLSDIAQLALGLVCILACIQAFQRSHGIARYAWRLLAITFVVWAAAQTLGVYAGISGDHWLDPVNDILFYVSLIPIGMLPFLDPDGEPNRFDRLHILDFVQVCLFSAAIFLSFSANLGSPATPVRLEHFTWSRNISFDGLLAATFVLRALLTQSKPLRSLFGRMALFLLLSGLADSCALSPGHDLLAGGWFDLIWSALLGAPILIAATWKSTENRQTDGSSRSQRIFVKQVFPVLYPVVTFFILAQANRAYPLLSGIVFALAFLTFAARVLVIQHRQAQSEIQLRLDMAKRERTEEALRQSEIQYRLLFDSNPIPMWVFDRTTLKFLAVNEAAIRHYGFSQHEFLAMTLADIRPEEDIPHLLKTTSQRIQGLQEATIWRHRKKDGAIIDVEIVGHDLDFHGIEAELVAARDVTERKKAEEAIERLASLVEFSEDAIIGKTIDGVIISWNQAAEKIYGYTRGEAVGRNSSLLVPLEKQDEMQSMMERVRSGRPIQCIETQRLTKAGSLLDVSVSFSPIKDATGQITGISAISRDITLRKRSEEQLHLQSAALEAAASAIVITDHAGRIVWVNRAFTLMTGYSRQEVLGQNPSILKSGEHSQSYYTALWSTISSGKVWKGEVVNRRKDGTAYTEEMTITPVTQQSGHATNSYFIAIKQDITLRKRSEEMLQNNENKYRALFQDSADANWLMNENGFLDCNSAALQMFGYSNWEEITHPADISPPIQPDGSPSRMAAEQKIASAFLNGKERFEWLYQRKNGELFPTEVCLTALTLSGRPTLLATVRDITRRKQAEEALLFKTALLEAQTETAIDGILAVDESDQIVLINRQFGRNFEIPDELLNSRDDHRMLEFVTQKVENSQAFLDRVKYLNSHREENSRDEIRFKNGKIFDRYSAPLVDSQNHYRGRIWYFRDITDRKRAEERIQFLAYYDALTGLPNRTLLQDRLTKALAEARRLKDRVALLFLDLDRFKDINDSLGHSVGDLLLQKVAGRLKAWSREQDTIARLGGDEFLIMLTHINNIPDAAIAAERLMDVMAAGFSVQGHTLNVNCSVGISIFPENGIDDEALIKNADAAMYSAKDNGRNHFRFFTSDMNAQVVERLTVENGLRLALEKQQLSLVYQPQVNIVTGKITGLEALLRWTHPELGMVAPDRFIRIAENSGLIVPIGEWVLRTACAQARQWQQAGLPDISIAVNVSAVQFRQENFCGLVKKVLHETGLAPQYLELEITESLLLANADVMLSIVHELRAMGVTLAIDDFGTGYSSFSYLRQFRVNKFKIDQSFIRDVAVNPDDAAITAAIISMAKSLNLKVIAEGVENEAQVSFLRAHQCDEVQGYYISRPLAVDKIADKLRGTGMLALSASHGS